MLLLGKEAVFAERRPYGNGMLVQRSRY